MSKKTFEIPQGSKQLTWKVAMKREGALPLDISSVFTSLEDAKKYVAGTDNSVKGVPYIGQIIAVSTTDGVSLYKVEETGTESGLVDIFNGVDFSDYYTSDEVDAKIASITLAQFVTELPSAVEAKPNQIYIIPTTDENGLPVGPDGNMYTEYIYNSKTLKWEKIGEFKADITVDNELSKNSTNPVQNKVVYNEFVAVRDEMTKIVAGDIEESLKTYAKIGNLNTINGNSLYDGTTTKDVQVGTIREVKVNGNNVVSGTTANINLSNYIERQEDGSILLETKPDEMSEDYVDAKISINNDNTVKLSVRNQSSENNSHILLNDDEITFGVTYFGGGNEGETDTVIKLNHEGLSVNNDKVLTESSNVTRFMGVMQSLPWRNYLTEEEFSSNEFNKYREGDIIVVTPHTVDVDGDEYPDPSNAPTTEYILVHRTVENTEEGGPMRVWMWEDFGEDIEFREYVDGQLSGYNEELAVVKQDIGTLSGKVGVPKSDNENASGLYALLDAALARIKELEDKLNSVSGTIITTDNLSTYIKADETSISVVQGEDKSITMTLDTITNITFEQAVDIE